MKKIEEELFLTLGTDEETHRGTKCIKDEKFLGNLADWIVVNFGNVNVAQRLHIMAIKNKS